MESKEEKFERLVDFVCFFLNREIREEHMKVLVIEKYMTYTQFCNDLEDFRRKYEMGIRNEMMSGKKWIDVMRSRRKDCEIFVVSEDPIILNTVVKRK